MVDNLEVPTKNGMKVEECADRENCKVPHLIVYTPFTEVNIYEDGRIFVNHKLVSDKGGKLNKEGITEWMVAEARK